MWRRIPHELSRSYNNPLSELEKRVIEKAHEHVTKETAIEWLKRIEQGKEWLHPYALKIITRKAMGNPMNRLESIKKRLDTFKADWKASRGCCDVEDFSDEVEYLLQRLERYEKALKEMCALEIPFSENGFTFKDMAFEALKEEE